ncbi:MAG: hypothetical protein RLZZ435_186 [Cyanobacteriota bacterium]
MLVCGTLELGWVRIRTIVAGINAEAARFVALSLGDEARYENQCEQAVVCCQRCDKSEPGQVLYDNHETQPNFQLIDDQHISLQVLRLFEFWR